MSELCISCNFSVGRRQAVTCDVSGRKQHRLCGTGITQDQYRAGQLKFICEPCVVRIPPRENDGVEVGDEATELFLEEMAAAEEDTSAAISEAPNFTIEVSFQNSSTNGDILPSDDTEMQEQTGQSEADETINYSEDQMDVFNDPDDSDSMTREEASTARPSLARPSLDATFDLAHRNTDNEPEVMEE